MLAKRTYKNQVTIPKEVMNEVGEIDYFDVSYQNGRIILKPVEITGHGERLKTVKKKIQELGLTENDIDDAIRWARGKGNRS